MVLPSYKRLLRISSNQQELLKYIALLAMVIDHFALLFFSNQNLLHTIIGRFVFPAFAFLMVYNYIHNTKNKIKYLFKLLMTAIVSQPVYIYAFNYDPKTMNILFTLFFGLGFIYLYDCKEAIIDKYLMNKWYLIGVQIILGFLIPLIFILLSVYLSYTIFGLIIIFTLYAFLKSGKKLFYIQFFIALLFLNIPSLNPISIASTLLIIPIIHIVKLSKITIKRQKSWLFYIFYPVHLLLLKLVHQFT